MSSGTWQLDRQGAGVRHTGQSCLSSPKDLLFKLDKPVLQTAFSVHFPVMIVALKILSELEIDLCGTNSLEV